MKTVYKFYEQTQMVGWRKAKINLWVYLFNCGMRSNANEVKRMWVELISWTFRGPFWALLTTIVMLIPILALTASAIISAPILAMSSARRIAKYYEKEVHENYIELAKTYLQRNDTKGDV